MRAITRIILVLITLAILLLPFYLLVRYMSRKYVKQEIGNSKKYAAITIKGNEVTVKNETNLNWKTYSVHIFTKFYPTMNEGFTYCQTGQENETICANLLAGETVKFPLEKFYSFMPKVQYDKAWELGGTGVTFTILGSNEEYEYYDTWDEKNIVKINGNI